MPPKRLRKLRSSKFVLALIIRDKDELITMSYDLAPLTLIQANLLWSMNTEQLQVAKDSLVKASLIELLSSLRKDNPA